MREGHAQKGGYLFLSGFASLYDGIHGWMMGWTDGKKLTKNDHDVLYYIVPINKQVEEDDFI